MERVTRRRRGIAASRAATTGRWRVASTIRCWAVKLTAVAAAASNPINCGDPGESSGSAVRRPIAGPAARAGATCQRLDGWRHRAR
jgi:hypothetical protein